MSDYSEAELASDYSEADLAALELGHEQQITRLRALLNGSILSIQASVSCAISQLEELRSDEVYDIDFAEGAGGDAIERLLAEMHRHALATQALIYTIESGRL